MATPMTQSRLVTATVMLLAAGTALCAISAFGFRRCMDLLLPALALAMCYFYRQRFSGASLASPLHSFKAARAATVSVLPTIPEEEEDTAGDAEASADATAAVPATVAATPAPRRTAKHNKPRREAKAAAAKATAAAAAEKAAAPVATAAPSAPASDATPPTRAAVSAASAQKTVEATMTKAAAHPAGAAAKRPVAARPRASSSSSEDDDACSVSSAESRYSERSGPKLRASPTPAVDFRFGTVGDAEDKPCDVTAPAARATFAAVVKAPIARPTTKSSASMPPPGFTAAAAAPQFRVWRADNATIDAVSRRMKTWNQAPTVDSVATTTAAAAPRTGGFSLFASSAGATLGVAAGATSGRKKLHLSKPKVAYVEPRWAAGPDGGRGFGRRRAVTSK